jgi:hypothetical protein
VHGALVSQTIGLPPFGNKGSSAAPLTRRHGSSSPPRRNHRRFTSRNVDIHAHGHAGNVQWQTLVDRLWRSRPGGGLDRHSSPTVSQAGTPLHDGLDDPRGRHRLPDAWPPRSWASHPPHRSRRLAMPEPDSTRLTQEIAGNPYRNTTRTKLRVAGSQEPRAATTHAGSNRSVTALPEPDCNGRGVKSPVAGSIMVTPALPSFARFVSHAG